jgi:hypothetical protein
LDTSIDTLRDPKISLILPEFTGHSTPSTRARMNPPPYVGRGEEGLHTTNASDELGLEKPFVSTRLENSPDDLDQHRRNQINVGAVATLTNGNGVIVDRRSSSDGG